MATAQTTVDDVIASLKAGESRRISAPTDVDRALEVDSIAWFVTYEQDVKELNA